MLINGIVIKTTNDALAKYIFTTDGSEMICKNFINAILKNINFTEIDN